MAENESLLVLVSAAFPVDPLPTRFFSPEGDRAFDFDIPQELKNRIAGRLWTQVTLLDWRMTGTSPVVARRYLEPATFMYYVPSIIVGTLQKMDFIEFALEGIMPDNKYHVPRGEWWSEFSKIASPAQRAAFSAFLSYVRHSLWGVIGPANQHLLEHAENIWDLR